MNTRHYPHWPTALPYAITTPATSVYVNLQVSALRYPNKPAIIFYDSVLSYAQVHDEVTALAGHLQQVCGVQRGDRVLLNMQNSPQFIIAYFAILRADAMVVPVNPMLMTEELKHYVEDSGARVGLVSQEIFSRLAPLVGQSVLSNVVIATYSDYLTTPTDLKVPDFCARHARFLPCRAYWGGKRRLPHAMRHGRIRRDPMTWPACPIPPALPASPRAASIRTVR